MTDPQKQLIGVVIKPDGMVKFDDGSPDYIRDHIIAHLVTQGHIVQPVGESRHVKIANWKS